MEVPDNWQSQERQELQEFIDSNPDSRELKRALVIQMLSQGLRPAQIQSILGVSAAFISKWKTLFAFEGVAGLKLKHQGSKGYLNPEERVSVMEWIESQSYLDVLTLENFIEDHYGIRFASKQSYYSLLKEAGKSWKKTQKRNPKRDPEQVEKKHQEIVELLETNREDIESGKLVVYLSDECHLLWGDACGYAWGATHERLEIPMANERERQTYYGALNYKTQQFIVRKYDRGNAKNTVCFLESLRELTPESRLLIIWDGASYHKYSEMKDYLSKVNQGLEPQEWRVHCVLFAPNAPEQNPVEDIWLLAKNFLRKFWHKLNSFRLMRWLFEFFFDYQVFDFPKIHKYGFFGEKEMEVNA